MLHYCICQGSRYVLLEKIYKVHNLFAFSGNRLHDSLLYRAFISIAKRKLISYDVFCIKQHSTDERSVSLCQMIPQETVETDLRQ